MKITKYVHSCLLLEQDGISILVDPGNYSYDEKVFNINDINALDYVVITHEHQDHMYVPFLKEILEKFPEVQVITTDSAQQLLAREGISAGIESTEFIHAEAAAHEKLLNMPLPANQSFTFFNSLTHPGDSLTFTKSAPVLALPIQAPWGSLVAACQKAAEMKPKKVLPIHDWHWNEKARQSLYSMAASYFKDHDIEFIPLVNGKLTEIE